MRHYGRYAVMITDQAMMGTEIGDRLGQVEPIETIGTDRARLDSYTESFRQAQQEYLGFRAFVSSSSARRVVPGKESGPIL
ncbi:hypothetical protein ECTPHS_10781 [Ectothiorhodospira sp. PHS-1]|nr:hypothetical protein ECTPHS_10781 [Ectothiorhodospira sp. PHS-1]